MTYMLTNIPEPDSGEYIECEPIISEQTGDLVGFRLYVSKGEEFAGEEKIRVVSMGDIHSVTPEGLARGIAQVATMCRDRGIEMGKQEVRRALGV